MKKTMTKDAVDSFFTHLKKSILSQGDTVKQATQIAKSADNALSSQQATIEVLAKSIETLTQKVEALQTNKVGSPVIQKSVTHVAPEAHPLNAQSQAQDETAPMLIEKAFDLLKSTNDKARQADLGRAISLLNVGANPAEIKKNYKL